MRIDILMAVEYNGSAASNSGCKKVQKEVICMLFWLILLGVVSSVCQYLVVKENKAGGLNQENSTSVVTVTLISIASGLLLYYLASFGIELYDDNRLDFYEYGEITAQGVEYFATRLVGAIIVAESVINVLVCIALGLKNKPVPEEK